MIVRSKALPELNARKEMLHSMGVSVIAISVTCY